MSLSPSRDIWTHYAPNGYLQTQDTKHWVNKTFQKRRIAQEIKCEVLIRNLVFEAVSMDQKKKKMKKSCSTAWNVLGQNSC